jgi:hypothetical protein
MRTVLLAAALAAAALAASAPAARAQDREREIAAACWNSPKHRPRTVEDEAGWAMFRLCVDTTAAFDACQEANGGRLPRPDETWLPFLDCTDRVREARGRQRAAAAASPPAPAAPRWPSPSRPRAL